MSEILFEELGCIVLDRASGKDKHILQGVTGACIPGRLFALMGASGAGKTTLLDVLALRQARGGGGRMEGNVLVDGTERDPKLFKKLSCYLTQKDLLFPSATVRESVTASAMLRLPGSLSHKAKKLRVEAVLTELDLLDCADTLIGDDVIGIKGVSGGQKRRTSLAVELVKDPIVIFADEPTSGLDSEVALSIMEALRSLARKNRTVVCTIHQPNSDITDLFDDFMLLAHGRCVYQGSWKNAVPWFGAQGFVAPTYKNPTDYFMSVIKDKSVSRKLSEATQADIISAKHKRITLAVGRGRKDCSSREGGVTAEDERASCGIQLSQSGPVTTTAVETPTELGGSGGPYSPRAVVDSSAITMPSSPTGATVAAVPPFTVGAANETANTAGGGAPGRKLQGEGGKNKDLSRLSSLGEEIGTSPDAAVAGRSSNGDGEGSSLLEASKKHDREHSLKYCTSMGGTDRGASIWLQMYVLAGRTTKNWIRNPGMLASEFIQYVFIALFVGLMYLGAMTLDEDGVQNRFACIWFAFAVMSFTPSYTTVYNFIAERPLVSKELEQRQYSIIAMYLARALVLIPIQLAQCLVFVSIMYFFAGLRPGAEPFFLFYFTLSIFQLLSEGVGLLCAVLTRQATFAIILLTLTLLILLSFSGFLITKTPVYFIWVNKISYLTYAYNTAMMSELSGLYITPAIGLGGGGGCPPQSFPLGQPMPPFLPPSSAIGAGGAGGSDLVNAETLMPPSMVNGLTTYQNLGVLVAIWAAMEGLKVAALHVAHAIGVL